MCHLLQHLYPATFKKNPGLQWNKKNIYVNKKHTHTHILTIKDNLLNKHLWCSQIKCQLALLKLIQTFLKTGLKDTDVKSEF